MEGYKNLSLLIKFNFDIFNTSTLHLLTKYIMNHYLIIPRLPKKNKHRFKVQDEWTLTYDKFNI